jgi:glucokinase
MVSRRKGSTTGRKSVLAGDIGGTKTRLGIFASSRGTPVSLREATYTSREHGSLEEIIEDFLADDFCVDGACFGVAGPVENGVAAATNLPWQMRTTRLKRKLQTEAVELINDLVANAYSLQVVEKRDLATLSHGRRRTGNAAMLSAGTGLGAAILFWNGKKHIPHPSEGGHVEFGPKSRLELDLLKYLFERFGHVSYERVLSGGGLFNIYRFLRDAEDFGKEPGWLAERLEQGDPAAVITETARLGKNRLCTKALDLFVSIYGAAAGNLALQITAVSGLYIGGGIAPKIIWKLRDGTFMKAFREKGRLSSIVWNIPVRVIMNERAALLGAAARAIDSLGDCRCDRTQRSKR